MSTAEKFRRKFRQKRRFLEVTQREIGKAVGYTQVSICRFEKGEIRLPEETVEKMVDYLCRIEKEVEPE